MKYWIVFLCMIILSSLYVNAQTTGPTPQPPSRPVRSGSRSSMPITRDNTSFEQLRALEIRRTKEDLLENPLAELGNTIYRKPNKEEIRILNPSAYLLDKYAAFLDQPDVGIVKLNADSSCFEELNVVVAKETCLQYSMPGAGTAFSFRVENYRIPRLADLILSKDVLKTDGVLQQGILVKLGDISLENVSLQTKGLKYLVDFKPAVDLESLLKNDQELSKGIEADGFLYRLGFYVSDQTTYALRSIAYRGRFMRSIKGITYNELDFDKRKDVVVAFRIVEKDAGGNITLLWKILSEINAPVLKKEKR
jgi:hypothetical protein